MRQVNGIMGVSGYVMDAFPGVGKPAPLSRAKRVRRADAPTPGNVNTGVANAIRAGPSATVTRRCASR